MAESFSVIDVAGRSSTLDDILKAVPTYVKYLLGTDDYSTGTVLKALTLLNGYTVGDVRIKKVSEEAQKCGLGDLFIKMSKSLQNNYTRFESTQQVLNLKNLIAVL